MSDLPKTMKAIKVVAPGKAEVQEVPLPRMRDDYILVKTRAVALNPTDWYVCDDSRKCRAPTDLTTSQETRRRPRSGRARHWLHCRL